VDLADPVSAAAFIGLSATAAGADVVGGALALRLKPGTLDPRYIIAFSSGLILAAAFFELMPEALEGAGGSPGTIRLMILLMALGFFVFYIIEKGVMLHSCGERECETHGANWISVAGMAADNIVDGIGIAVGFLVDWRIGLAITLAVVAHEVPQGMASVEILRKMNVPARRALLIVGVAGSMYVAGALLSFVIPPEFYVLTIAFVAGAFLYVGSADLLAEAHRRFNVQVIASVVGGAMFMYFIINLVEHGNLWGG
jgi:zinc and cadmium transporter